MDTKMVHGDGQIIGNGTAVIEGIIAKQEDADDLLLLNISLAYRSPGKFRGILFGLPALFAPPPGGLFYFLPEYYAPDSLCKTFLIIVLKCAKSV